MTGQTLARRQPAWRIRANPLASAAALRWLSEEDPRAALQHPNCPVELWWEIAAQHPIVAQESVLYPLLTLERPECWIELEKMHIDAWINHFCDLLSGQEELLLGAEYAERVLPIFERECPNEARPRTAISARRRFAEGKAIEREWTNARIAAQQVNVLYPCPSRHAARQAAVATSRISAWAIAQEASEAVAMNTLPDALKIENETWHGNEICEAATYAEKQWQWRRLQQYLTGETDG